MVSSCNPRKIRTSCPEHQYCDANVRRCVQCSDICNKLRFPDLKECKELCPAYHRTYKQKVLQNSIVLKNTTKLSAKRLERESIDAVEIIETKQQIQENGQGSGKVITVIIPTVIVTILVLVILVVIGIIGLLCVFRKGTKHKMTHNTSSTGYVPSISDQSMNLKISNAMLSNLSSVENHPKNSESNSVRTMSQTRDLISCTDHELPSISDERMDLKKESTPTISTGYLRNAMSSKLCSVENQPKSNVNSESNSVGTMSKARHLTHHLIYSEKAVLDDTANERCFKQDGQKVICDQNWNEPNKRSPVFKLGPRGEPLLPKIDMVHYGDSNFDKRQMSSFGSIINDGNFSFPGEDEARSEIMQKSQRNDLEAEVHAPLLAEKSTVPNADEETHICKSQRSNSVCKIDIDKGQQPETGSKKPHPNRKIYEVLKGMDWVNGYFSEGKSIEVYADFDYISPDVAMKELTVRTGYPDNKFHLKESES